MSQNQDIDSFMMFLKLAEIKDIGNAAIRKVQDENRLKGIPLVYSVDGKIYYELADGTVTTKSPFTDDNKKSH